MSWSCFARAGECSPLTLERLREHLPLTTINLVINWDEEITQRLR